MKRLAQAALLTELADTLQNQGSWCGETHIQKSVYFLQQLKDGVPFDFEFVLYKHGPFSFDLRDELTALRADGLLDLRPQPPYGPSLTPTDASKELRKLFPKTLNRYRRQIDFVAKHVGNRNVAELEKLSTALYITLSGKGKQDIDQRAKELSKLKPHISLQEAQEAVRAIDDIVTKWNE